MRLRILAAFLLLSPLVNSDRVTARSGAAAQARAAQAPAGSVFAAAPDQRLSADGVTLRYRELGTGEPVVLIHGYAASLESLTGLANVLASTHRVVAFDVRGFGQSSKFAQPARFGQSMVDDVVRLMDHLKITRAHLIGHSMGALIAANVANRYPARVTTAALVAGPFYKDKATFDKEATRWAGDLESGKGLVAFMQWLFPKMPPEMAAGVNAQMLKANDVPSLIAVMRSLPELAIPGLRAPGVTSLVAVGTGDPLHPLSVEFVKGSSGARLLEIEGADHVTVIANPAVLKALGELLRTSSSSGLQDAA
jgi:pimeloyl-ACP methyl ester carboxylesterase